MSTEPTPHPSPQPKPAPNLSWVVRVAVLLILAGAVTLLLVSLRHLTRLQAESEAQNQQLTRLVREVEQMNSALSPLRVARAEAAYEQGQSLLLRGDPAVTAWAEDVKARAAALGLECRAELGAPLAHTDWSNQIALVPVNLEIRPARGTDSPRSPYQRVLEFCQHVSNQPTRTDWLELSVIGTSNSVSSATVALNLWMSVEAAP